MTAHLFKHRLVFLLAMAPACHIANPGIQNNTAFSI
jgi:hypothetical protein